MQELAKELISATELGKDFKGKPTQDLREASKKWAGFVLQNNTGEVLKKGLVISLSICDYLNEIEKGD